MKKVAIWAVIASLLLGAVPMAAYAEGEEGMAGEGEEPPVAAASEEEVPTETTVADLYEYTVTGDGYAKLTKFKPGDSYQGAVEIPSMVDDYYVIDIASGCFLGCTGITSVKIPEDITDMGSSVFWQCTSLESFEVAPGNPYFSVQDGVLFGDEGKFLIAYPAAKSGDSYTTSSKVEEIAPGAFNYAQNLKEIYISKGTTNIDNWAFGFSALEKAEIAGTVEQIDDYAFAYCDHLSDVKLEEGIQKIYNASFAFCPSLIQITLPSTLEHIGQYAFCATGLTCVTIPSRVERVDFCAFGYDGDYQAIPSFVVYGEKNSFAQEYCTSSDPENDYENHFKFIEVENADQPYELANGTFTAPEVAEDVESAAEEVAQEGEPSASEKLGAGLKSSKSLQMLLGIGGGMLVLVAVILIVAYSLNPKRKAKSGKKGASAKKNEND